MLLTLCFIPAGQDVSSLLPVPSAMLSACYYASLLLGTYASRTVRPNKLFLLYISLYISLTVVFYHSKINMTSKRGHDSEGMRGEKEEWDRGDCGVKIM